MAVVHGAGCARADAGQGGGVMTSKVDSIEQTERDSVMSEDQAIDVVIGLEQRFGWSATIVTKRDVEDTVGRKLSDDQWGKLTVSRSWRRHVADAMWEGVQDAVHQAFEDVLGDEDEGEM